MYATRSRPVPQAPLRICTPGCANEALPWQECRAHGTALARRHCEASRCFGSNSDVILGLVPRIHRAAGASGTMDPRHEAEDDSGWCRPRCPRDVIPAQAGICPSVRFIAIILPGRIPAFAGMTLGERWAHSCHPIPAWVPALRCAPAGMTSGRRGSFQPAAMSSSGLSRGSIGQQAPAEPWILGMEPRMTVLKERGAPEFRRAGSAQKSGRRAREG